MRNKFLLTLALGILTAGFVGCDSTANQVGTGTAEPPPEVKERLKKQEEEYANMMKNSEGTPVPSEGQSGGAPNP